MHGQPIHNLQLVQVVEGRLYLVEVEVDLLFFLILLNVFIMVKKCIQSIKMTFDLLIDIKNVLKTATGKLIVFYITYTSSWFQC